MIRFEAEATCSFCGAKTRCVLDADALMSGRIASPGGAIRGLPTWYWKDAGQKITGTPNLACSEKCVAKLVKEETVTGEWKKIEWLGP